VDHQRIPVTDAEKMALLFLACTPLWKDYKAGAAFEDFFRGLLDGLQD
jgi:hypothetical protein